MQYAVGTRIDLTHLNTHKVTIGQPAPKPQMGAIYDAGTQLIFQYMNGRFVTARRINVAFA